MKEKNEILLKKMRRIAKLLLLAGVEKPNNFDNFANNIEVWNAPT
eukprot:CAMPEP_0201553968 /NCGR_PEP_ID=MMETSP0173_2-20130828/36165_1 /ASSEMBLY_ACC=CAM_ASM_000268 /TAXON_ID=218659 /ORGANISM="Vexillifera sp., Strain DIVA3 564/2" /LENGTH=44 /DNA_ID= /DNA_START= /DNA_END= /DNA_ORIENTATION=